MEITKREIIASIAIVAILLIIGFIISGKITDSENDRNSEYQKAVHITNSELFQYGMETNVGNAFVYGEIEPVDTVTFEEIGGRYLYVEKIKERYERHEREVTKKDKNGKEYEVTEEYYQWDTESRETKHVNEILFCGIVFPYGKINLPGYKYIDTIRGDREWSWESGEIVKVRYKYYGVSTNYTGTIYTRLSDNSISDNSPFYEDYTIEQTLERCISGGGNIIFWITWILFTGVCVYVFCYLDNKWLED